MVSSVDLNRIKSFSVYKPVFSKLSNLRGDDQIINECEFILDNYFFDLTKDEIAVLYKIMASVYFYKNLYKKCIYYAERAINTIPVYFFTDILTELYIIIGRSYQSLNDYSNALFYYNKIVMNYDSFYSCEFSCEVLYNIGFLYYQFGDYINAIKNFEICVYKNIENNLFSTPYSFISIYLLFSYIEVDKMDKVEEKYRQIKEELKNENSFIKDALLHSIEYGIFESKSDYKNADKSFRYFMKNIRYIDDNVYQLEILFFRLKKIYERADYNRLIGVESLLLQCEELAIKLNDDIKLSYIYKKLMLIYENNQDFDQIYKVYEKYFYVAEKLDKTTSVTGISVMNSIYHDFNVEEEKNSDSFDDSYALKLSNIKNMSDRRFEKEEAYYFDIIYNALCEISGYDNPGNAILELKKLFDNILFLDQVSALTYNIQGNTFNCYCIIDDELVTDINEDYDFMKVLLMKATVDSKYSSYMCNNSKEIEELIGQKIYTHENGKLINSIVCVSAEIKNQSDNIICFSSTDKNAYKNEHLLILKFLNDHFIASHKNKIARAKLKELEEYNVKLLENLDTVNKKYSLKVGKKYNEATGINNSGYFENKVIKMFSSDRNSDYSVSLTYIKVVALENGMKIYPHEEYKQITDIVNSLSTSDNIVVGMLLDDLFAVAIKGKSDREMFDVIQILSSRLFKLANDELSINVCYLSSQNVDVATYFALRTELVNLVERTTTEMAFSLTRDRFDK